MSSPVEGDDGQITNLLAWATMSIDQDIINNHEQLTDINTNKPATLGLLQTLQKDNKKYADALKLSEGCLTDDEKPGAIERNRQYESTDDPHQRHEMMQGHLKKAQEIHQIQKEKQTAFYESVPGRPWTYFTGVRYPGLRIIHSQEDGHSKLKDDVERYRDLADHWKDWAHQLSNNEKDVWVRNAGNLHVTSSTNTVESFCLGENGDETWAGMTILKVIFGIDAFLRSPVAKRYQKWFPEADMSKWEPNTNGPTQYPSHLRGVEQPVKDASPDRDAPITDIPVLGNQHLLGQQAAVPRQAVMSVVADDQTLGPANGAGASAPVTRDAGPVDAPTAAHAPVESLVLQRLEKVDQKLDKVDQKLDRVEQKLDQLIKTLAKMETCQGRTEEKVSQMLEEPDNEQELELGEPGRGCNAQQDDGWCIMGGGQ